MDIVRDLLRHLLLNALACLLFHWALGGGGAA